MIDLSQYKFRPQQKNKKWILRKWYPSDCHWYLRKSFKREEPLNQLTMGRIFGRLHYLSSHAPKAAAKQWRNADLQFRIKHIPYRNNSMRYLKLFTADSWL